VFKLYVSSHAYSLLDFVQLSLSLCHSYACEDTHKPQNISSEPFLRRGAGCCQPRIRMSWVDNGVPEERVRIPPGIRTGEEGMFCGLYFV